MLPLKLLIVDYLKNCASPLVNPFIESPEVVEATSDDCNMNQDDLKPTNGNQMDPIPDKKRENINGDSLKEIDYDKYLKDTTRKCNYSVVIDKLSNDDINLWTSKVVL